MHACIIGWGMSIFVFVAEFWTGGYDQKSFHYGCAQCASRNLVYIPSLHFLKTFMLSWAHYDLHQRIIPNFLGPIHVFLAASYYHPSKSARHANNLLRILPEMLAGRKNLVILSDNGADWNGSFLLIVSAFVWLCIAEHRADLLVWLIRQTCLRGTKNIMPCFIIYIRINIQTCIVYTHTNMLCTCRRCHGESSLLWQVVERSGPRSSHHGSILCVLLEVQLHRETVVYVHIFYTSILDSLWLVRLRHDMCFLPCACFWFHSVTVWVEEYIFCHPAANSRPLVCYVYIVHYYYIQIFSSSIHDKTYR